MAKPEAPSTSLAHKEVPASKSKEVQNRFLNLRDHIWENSYKKNNHAEARKAFNGLLAEAKAVGERLEVRLKILVGEGWSAYHEERLGGAEENTAYTLVEKALEENKDADIEPVTRSDLYQIAGLSRMANVDKLEAKGKKEEAEGNKAEARRLLGLSLESAEESGDSSTIGAAKNGIGIELNKQGSYTEATEYLTAAVRLHEEGGDTTRQGNAWNNLIVSYRGSKDLPNVKIAAAKALELYGDPKLHHSFGVRSKLVDALVELGDNEDQAEAVRILKEQIKLRTGDSDPETLDDKDKAKEFNKQDQDKIKAIEKKIAKTKGSEAKETTVFEA